MATKIIRSEKDLKKWFLKNYKSLGYSKILRKDIGEFPDFIMIKKGKKFNVELETLSSNFILHKHDKNAVDEIICVKKDAGIGAPLIELKHLEYIPKMSRISATVGDKTIELIGMLLKDTSEFRNKSHLVEKAIEFLWGEKYDKHAKD